MQNLNLPLKYSNGFTTGLLEITNGISIISSINIKQLSNNIILVSFILGFGGLSVLFQILSIISKFNISIKPYILGKLLQACFASIYTLILISNIPFFKFDL
ncbi:Sporulation integral membrane protein YlbJ [compost metagenome]